jgi:NFU1 iron-sulfur cluster scaffold homolog, mitochondrial
MMRHYLPDVTSVRQVMDDEEEIALKEFEKLEAKLSQVKGPEAVSETGDSRV